MTLVLVVDHGLLIDGTATALVPLTHQLFEKGIHGTVSNALKGAAVLVVPRAGFEQDLGPEQSSLTPVSELCHRV